MNWLVKFWPIIVALVVVSGAAYTAQFKINAVAKDMIIHVSDEKAERADIEGDIEENADEIEGLRRDQIRQEGENALKLQQLQNDVDGIGTKIDLLIQMQTSSD